MACPLFQPFVEGFTLQSDGGRGQGHLSVAAAFLEASPPAHSAELHSHWLPLTSCAVKKKPRKLMGQILTLRDSMEVFFTRFVRFQAHPGFRILLGRTLKYSIVWKQKVGFGPKQICEIWRRNLNLPRGMISCQSVLKSPHFPELYEVICPLPR